MEEDKYKKSDIVAKCLGIIVGIALVLGISYGLFAIVIEGKKINKIATGTLRLELIDTDEDNPQKYTYIELTNAYPVTDKEGLETTPYTFTLENTGNIDASYTVSLEVLKTSTLSDEFVKFAIQKENKLLNNQFESTPMLLEDVKSTETINLKNEEVILYVLDEGVINVDENIDYKLNLWLDYDASNDAMNKKLTATIRVDGIQKNR